MDDGEDDPECRVAFAEDLSGGRGAGRGEGRPGRPLREGGGEAVCMPTGGNVRVPFPWGEQGRRVLTTPRTEKKMTMAKQA